MDPRLRASLGKGREIRQAEQDARAEKAREAAAQKAARIKADLPGARQWVDSHLFQMIERATSEGKSMLSLNPLGGEISRGLDNEAIKAVVNEIAGLVCTPEEVTINIAGKDYRSLYATIYTVYWGFDGHP